MPASGITSSTDAAKQGLDDVVVFLFFHHYLLRILFGRALGIGASQQESPKQQGEGQQNTTTDMVSFVSEIVGSSGSLVRRFTKATVSHRALIGCRHRAGVPPG